MLTRLEIENYRAFSKMRLEGLTRVNLLVGKNGCGKTSVLEAVSLLAGNGSPLFVLMADTVRQGDWIQESDVAFGKERFVHHLFHGASLHGEASLRILGETSRPVEVHLQLSTLPESVVRSEAFAGRKLRWCPAPDSLARSAQRRVLVGRGDEDHPLVVLELSRWGRVSAAQLVDDEANDRDRLGVRFVPCSGIADQTLGIWFSDQVLTEAESRVLDVLRILRPDIERLVWIPESDAAAAGFYVKLRGEKERAPLSRFGEGLRRLLAIAITANKASARFLLIDEIDTGLHHTVLEQLWRALIELSRLLDVQIFATTHSGDCIRSLAWLIEDQPSYGPDVSLHRVDPTMDVSVRYGADEIALAARHHVEVRG